MQREAPHDGLNALIRPVPLGETPEETDLKVPALAPLEVGLHDLRYQHPHPRINESDIHADHRAEVDVHVLEGLLHAVADADVLDGEGGLPADNKVDISDIHADTADHTNVVGDLHPALDDGVGAHAEVQPILRRGHTAEGTHINGGAQHEGIDRIIRQVEREELRADEVEALVVRPLVIAHLPVELEGVAEFLDDIPGLAQTDNAHVLSREGDLTGPEDHLARALDEVQVCARQRAPQLQRRDGEIVALHRGRQILEARAAAVELSDGNRRDQGDAGVGLDVEPQLIGDQRAVLLAALQRQLGLRLEEVEGVQLQLEGVALLALEGVDLALHLRQLQRHQLRGVEAARGLYTVDLELLFLIQAEAQLFHVELRALQDGFEADPAAEDQIARPVGRGALQLHLGVGNVHKDDGFVLCGVNVKREALVRELDLQIALRTALRLIELEAGCTQMHAPLLYPTVPVDDQTPAAAPCGGDGGGEQCRAAGEGEFRAVFALIVAVDEANGVAVYQLQRRQRRITCHGQHHHAVPPGKDRQPLGVDGGIDLIRLCGHLRGLHHQIAEAPEVASGARIGLVVAENKPQAVLAHHPGVGGAAGRRHADRVRQIYLDGVGFILAIVSRQPHKGIGPVVAVRIDLGDAVVAPVAALSEARICGHILQLAGDDGAFGGKHRLFIIIKNGAAQLEGGAVRGLGMPHGGKAAEGIAPENAHIGVQRLKERLAVLLVDPDIVNGYHHAPALLGQLVLLKLHQLMVHGGRPANGELGQIDRQVIVRPDGLCRAVGRLVHKGQAFQAQACRMRGVP